jgi:cytochrome c-type biogenesis protein CcmH/NrfG
MKASTRLPLLSLVILGLLSSGANAQQGGAGGGKSGVAKVPPRVTPTTPTAPTQTSYYTGKVVLDTGIAPPTPVAVLRVCNGLSRRETFTSADGAFSFMVGDKFNEVMPDASDDTRGFGADSQYSRGTVSAMGPTNNPQSPLADCELRADLSGYTSSSIRLDPSMNNSNVGVIVLHSRMKKADGMVTVASLEVPPKARKEYEKASELLEKGNLAEAEKSLRKAIDIYPPFAEAWTRLGDLEQRRKNGEAAIKDYQEAISADPNLPIPYLRMAFLEAVAGNYEQTRKLTEKLLSLDPSDFPLAYYYNGVAEFNLKHLDKAESSALRAEKTDTQHAEPRVELLLASIYIAKGSYSSATDHYRAYLKLVPDGPLTARVKTDLAKTEELAKSQPLAPVPGNK